ncbi:MAG: SUMF1/EgtB/PvdO family nonheme iron enzyme [Planctomycetota bacterium]|jgi:formylglycine-generating enzyme required for sulfatase activity
MTKVRTLAAGLLIILLAGFSAAATQQGLTNSIGMEFVEIQSGNFHMGRLNAADDLDGRKYEFIVDGGDWDEKPVHKVKISRDFYIQRTEVTSDQYKKFDPLYQGKGRFATGISWHEATAFAQWLSQKEGRSYRLPTEAEWEYVCRAGTKSLFWSGDKMPEDDTNPWGVKNMHAWPREWVYDWYGKYLDDDQTDPVGPGIGLGKVLRGGGEPYHARSASRWSLPPESSAKFGFENIGFRLVIAAMPKSEPLHSVAFNQECIKQSTEPTSYGPAADKPYFNRRPALPIPSENDQDDAGPLVGIDPAVLAHCHSPGFVALPNGDLLAVYFTSSTATTEYHYNSNFVQARLRYGAESWDMPEMFIDFANMNEQSGLLWTENEKVWFFGGGRYWPNDIPFKWCVSTDNGATWTEPKLAEVKGKPGGYTSQPITNFFRDPDGNIYINTDGSGSSSLLWRSSDQGKTWMDTGGRTEGRHSAIVPIKDEAGKFSGKLLCLGTKKGMWKDSWMQQNISYDWGKTWEPKTKSPFPYLNSNQRGCLRRLASGRLVFVSDHQARNNQQPEGYTDRGCFIAISDDEGMNWHIKTIPDTLAHEGTVIKAKRKWTSAGHKDGTVGYVTVTQTPNGMIHVLTTMNHPCMHFEFNEAWIYSDDGAIYPSDPGNKGAVRKYEERYPGGKEKATWSAKIAPDGCYLLDGKETWHYENGKKQYEVTYKNGRKVGIETYWTPDGIKRWMWNHDESTGISIWTQNFSNGRKKCQSSWRGGKCEGIATRWDMTGKIVSEKKFVNGILSE